MRPNGGGNGAVPKAGRRSLGKSGFVVLDQIRTVDRVRRVRRLGALLEPAFKDVLGVLREMFET